MEGCTAGSAGRSTNRREGESLRTKAPRQSSLMGGKEGGKLRVYLQDRRPFRSLACLLGYLGGNGMSGTAVYLSPLLNCIQTRVHESMHMPSLSLSPPLLALAYYYFCCSFLYMC
eukprot:TRINITY_DN14358_c0_g1_i1.p2 TRINITY_DN14358_c0_g1~~TRINITY_DN14358_c0_g1_i1.p2  ORF type:complete len:115 (-),score=1.84 TRINITY_DN14358_c0_g1_i1:81-425(-)